jgi:hypothetical protein
VGGEAAHLQVVLDGDGHAVERAQRPAVAPARGALPGRVRGAFAVERDQRVQARVDLGAARHAGVQGVGRRERGLAKAGRELRRVELPERCVSVHRGRPHMCAGSHVTSCGTAISSSVNRIMISA